jgi:hypothetical protein
MLSFKIADAQTGRPPRDLEPYLGALAHVIAISEAGTEFVHAHPVAHGGASAAHRSGIHGGHHGEDSLEPTSKVSAAAVFPLPGRYKVWVQFRRGDDVAAAPFVVEAK